MQKQITLNENEWILCDKKIGIWYHKDNNNIIKSRTGIYDLNAVKFYLKLPTGCELKTNSIPSKYGYRKINTFPYIPSTKNILLNSNKKYTEKEILDLCKFNVSLDYEYLGQLENINNINNILRLCHTGK